MNVLCSNPVCPVILSSTCVFYEGENLVYSGINTNDTLELALQKIDTVIGTILDVGGGLEQYSSLPFFPITGATDILYIALDTNIAYYWNGTSYKPVNSFTSDITVSLPSPKTVGRYSSGQTIPATGKTAEEVLKLISVEPINPTVTLTSSSVVQFNQTAVSNILNYTKTINSLGAFVATASLEWRRNNAGSWVVLSSSTVLTTFTHNFTDSAFNTQVINYRYVVTDTQGATATATFDITPVAYVSPTATLNQVATALNGTQTNTTREKGNVSTNLTCTNITRTSPYVNLVSYQLQYSLNGGVYNNIGGATGALSGGTGSITPYTDSALSTSAATIQYRLAVTDTFTTTYFTSSLITFYYLYLFGYSTINGSLTGAQIYALGNGTLQTTKVRTIIATAPVSKWTYISFLTSFGTISNIIMDGATPVYGAFNSAPAYTSISVTNQYGVVGTYDLYKSNASNAFTSNSLAIT